MPRNTPPPLQARSWIGTPYRIPMPRNTPPPLRYALASEYSDELGAGPCRVGKIAAGAEQHMLVSRAILPTRPARVGIAPARPMRMRERGAAMPTLRISCIDR